MVKKNDLSALNAALILKFLRVSPMMLLFALLALHLILPDNTYSSRERRYLASWPRFSIAGFLNGSFSAKVEEYFADQFPFREFWLELAQRTSLIR